MPEQCRASPDLDFHHIDRHDAQRGTYLPADEQAAAMKRARFRDPSGSIRVGPVEDGVITAAGRTFDFDTVDILPPVDPGKVLGVGHNFRGRHEPDDLPEFPNIWWKGTSNVVAGHRDTVTIPDSGNVVYEVELGVVIGTQCRNVSVEAAPDVIAGYTVVNDISNMARRSDPTMFRAKSFENAAPMGPVLASPEHVDSNPRARLWINGEKRQDSTGDSYVFSIEEVVSEFTQHITLDPGDVIMMGNPGGFEPLQDGDTVELEIDGIGRLEHYVEIA